MPVSGHTMSITIGNIMSDKIIVQPRLVDGVEFYVSDLSEETGMSIAGLSRLCGVEIPSMSNFLQSVDEGNTKVDNLKSFKGRVFNVSFVRISAGNTGGIVRDEVCAAVIEYYAFESRSKNKHIALHTFRKFAVKGIRTWVRDVTGAAQRQDSQALMGAMQEILGQLQSLNHKVEKLEVTASKYENIRAATVTNFPGLDEMLIDFEKDSDRILPQSEDELTLTQWLTTKGITFTPNVKMRFGNLVGNTYRTLTGEPPRKARCKDKIGNYTEKQNVYKPCHYPILEVALKQMF
jgi:hypothetical protein